MSWQRSMNAYIEPAEVNAYVFCPRKWYYRYIMKMNMKNDAMEIGTYEHEHYWRNAQKRKELYLVSDHLKMKGKCDYLIEENGLQIPIEIKKGKCNGDAWRWDIMQLMCYILLLENHFNVKYPYGYINYIGSKRKLKIEVTVHLRNEVDHIIKQMKLHKNGKIIPKIKANQIGCDKCAIQIYCKA